MIKVILIYILIASISFLVGLNNWSEEYKNGSDR